MNTKRTLGILVFAAVLVGIASPGHALRIEMGEGMWPESWPEELEPLRGQSNSIQAGIGIAEVIYDITFTSREQFESVWPAILNLKSPGAPLRRFGGYNQRPMVRIYAPPSTGAIDLGPDGRKQEQRLGEQMNGASPEEHQRLRHAMHDLITKACNDGKHLMPGPPWPESVLTEDGEVPAYVNANDGD